MRFLQELSQVKLVHREEFLVQSATGKRVLHVGCVDAGILEERLDSGSLLHRDLQGAASELWGLDPDHAGIQRLRDEGYTNLYEGTAEHPPESVPKHYFDCVIAGEVIEHVRNVGLFLDATANLLVKHGTLVITTPNALRFYNPFPALLRKELVHPDHVAWYSPHTLRRAVELAPFAVDSIQVYDSAPTANPDRSTGVRRVFRYAFNAAMRPAHAVAVRLAPYLADGLILTARVR